MQRMNEGEWFCANCLQMIDVLSRHGRCPYCDSNAVDVAYRVEMTRSDRQAEASPKIALSINTRLSASRPSTSKPHAAN